MKNRGRLKFTSESFFYLLNFLEMNFQYLIESGQLYKSEAFLDIVYSVSSENLPQIGCEDEEHCRKLMSSVIFRYLLLRFKFLFVKRLGTCAKLALLSAIPF